MVTSSAVVGSSAIRISGLQIIAMAIITRCFMPPENWCGYSKARSAGMRAEGVACVGTKFVIWRKSEKVEQEKKKAAAKKPAKKVSGNYNPVKAGLRARKQAAEQQRKQRKQYFHDKAVSAAIERSRQQKEEQ